VPGMWVSLVLVDLVAVATFARCFTGPGELALLLPVCLLAHLLARLGRIVGARGNRLAGAGAWVLAALLVAWVPIAALDWHSLTWGLPLGRSQHVLASQFHAAWAIFSNRVAPVAENRGLVIASAWAAGAVGLAAEALDADAALPAIVALIPAFDIVVFTGTLGTAAGRAPELAALAAFSVAYLAAACRQSKGEHVVTARVEGSAAVRAPRRLGAIAHSAAANGSGRPVAEGPRAAADRAATARWRHKRLGALAAPGLVLIAALSAGLIGPLLPGAKSPPLVAWHGGPHAGRHGPPGGAVNHPNAPITISNLVQVGEEEIDNPAVTLFDEYGPEPTREVLATLDVFNGNQWFAGGSRSSLQGHGSTVPTFPHRLTIAQLERNPAALQVTPRATTITQVISIADLGGNELPVPGELVGADNVGHVALSGSAGAALISGSLSRGDTFVLRADLNPGWQVVPRDLQPGARGAPAVDTSLPLPVPVSITALADQWTQGATSPVQKALLIQDHLTSGQYRYALPRHVSSGAVSPASGYDQLANFLYDTRSGYCQQFASAFTVMARIEGLPTRIVVGLLPGSRLGRQDAWQVTGTDVHAWPQVYFKGTGWVDFEPTPGSPAPVVAPPPTTVPATPVKPNTSTPSTFAHNLAKAPPGGPARLGVLSGHQPGRLPQHGGGGGVLDVILGLLAAAALWSLVVPSWRLVRLRRSERDPVRGVLAEWSASVRLLAAAGFHRRRAETFDEYARRVRISGVLSTSADAALVRLVQATNRAMFGKTPPTPEEMKSVASDSTLVRRSARKRLAWWQKIVMEVDPRDLARTT
jgi:hypothetical protein